MDTPVKRCSRCKQEFPATPEYFWRNKSTPDGLQYRCKMCQSLHKQEWKQRHPDRFKAGSKRYYENNKDILKIKHKLYRKENTERDRENHKQWRQENPDKVRAYLDKYRATHREEIRERDKLNKRRLRRERPDIGKQSNKRWRLANKATVRTNNQRRKARKRSLPDTLTTADWQHALNYFNGCCAVCGRPPGLWHTLAMDHWIPLNNPNCPGTVHTNIVPLCHGVGGCNTSKKDKYPEQWVIETFGKRKASQILKRIYKYFESLSQ